VVGVEKEKAKDKNVWVIEESRHEEREPDVRAGGSSARFKIFD
jgi:hypothetical protein